MLWELCPTSGRCHGNYVQDYFAFMLIDGPLLDTGTFVTFPKHRGELAASVLVTGFRRMTGKA
jgi:hypothetical protein